MGLVEWEWLVTLATLEPDDVIYTDFVDVARELVPELFNMRYGNHPLIQYMYMTISLVLVQVHVFVP